MSICRSPQQSSDISDIRILFKTKEFERLFQSIRSVVVANGENTLCPKQRSLINDLRHSSDKVEVCVYIRGQQERRTVREESVDIC